MTSISKAFVATMAMMASSSTAREGGDNINFVFELTRHGARAPTATADNYSVAAGMLTPQGMRQRYLLGRYNRKRFTEEYDFISTEDGPEQFLMFSTDVDRTIQSGYSELMGMFTPDSISSNKLTTD